MEYDEPTACSLHQFLTGSSNLKAAAAGDCCVAIEFASKLMQNEPIFFVFTAIMMWSYIHGHMEYDEPTTLGGIYGTGFVSWRELRISG